jgi:hypothetical protein
LDDAKLVGDGALPRSVQRAVVSALADADSESDLLSHSVKWSPRTWTADFPRHEKQVDRVAEISDPVDGTYSCLSRAALFHLADEGDPLNLFVGVMAWGYGTGGRRWHVRRALGYKVGSDRVPRISDDQAEARIERAYALSRDDAITAYQSFALLGKNHLPGIGPAFASKFIYFAGFSRAAEDGRNPPLILDSLVAESLGGSRYDLEAYRRYLALSASLAGDQRPDIVELALFRHAWSRRPGRRGGLSLCDSAARVTPTPI